MSRKRDGLDFESLAIPYPEEDPEPPKDGWTFKVTPKEIKEHNKWMREHHEKLHGGKIPYAGAIGGAYTITFTSTGLGQIIGVECGHCKAKGLDRLDYQHCITDFEDW